MAHDSELSSGVSLRIHFPPLSFLPLPLPLSLSLSCHGDDGFAGTPPPRSPPGCTPPLAWPVTAVAITEARGENRWHFTRIPKDRRAAIFFPPISRAKTDRGSASFWQPQPSPSAKERQREKIPGQDCRPYLSINLFVCLSAGLSVGLSARLSHCVLSYIYPSVCVFLCLFICLTILHFLYSVCVALCPFI